MNPYTTRTRARIQPHDMASALLTDPFIGATTPWVGAAARLAGRSGGGPAPEGARHPAGIGRVTHRDGAADDRGRAHSDRPTPRRR